MSCYPPNPIQFADNQLVAYQFIDNQRVMSFDSRAVARNQFPQPAGARGWTSPPLSEGAGGRFKQKTYNY